MRPVVVLLDFPLFCRHVGCLWVLEPKFTFVLFDLQNSLFYTPTTLLLRVRNSSDVHASILQELRKQKPKRTNGKGQMVPFSRVYKGPFQWKITGRQKGGFVKGWFWRMYPRSGFRSGETCMRTSRFSFRGNIRMYPRSGFRSEGRSAKTTLLENHPLVNPRVFLVRKGPLGSYLRLAILPI